MTAIVLGMMTKKGGAGKSMLTKLLASAAVYSGKKVMVIDLDPEEDIASWWRAVTEKGNAHPDLAIRATREVTDLYDIIEANEEKYDFILIDTKGEGSEAADHLASVSDRILVPCLCADSDVRRTRETVQWYEGLKSRVDDPAQIPPLFVVLSRMPPQMLKYDGTGKPAGVVVHDFERFEAMLNEFNPLKAMVPDRTQYRDMDSRGLLGTLLDQAREGDALMRGQIPHYENALAHALNLMNSILKGQRMRSTNA
ncbi:ParA family protein [Paracoccus aestuarii]|uniref:ParA family protein n=1 Tax=Paracoccus aestuarii TaxID=453842 RepID=A0A418ZY97_9RHOB|nr:ParA family protein [Paracoccus aestuarii]RJL05477.1 ParA family protein [Paracoccus aestuarii]WCR01279.1 ParA family protein [Paracoccus aestuarii]